MLRLLDRLLFKWLMRRMTKNSELYYRVASIMWRLTLRTLRDQLREMTEKADGPAKEDGEVSLLAVDLIAKVTETELD